MVIDDEKQRQLLAAACPRTFGVEVRPQVERPGHDAVAVVVDPGIRDGYEPGSRLNPHRADVGLAHLELDASEAGRGCVLDRVGDQRAAQTA